MEKNTFVSYARDDKAMAESIVAGLRLVTSPVWFDQHLTGGQLWWDKILQEIRGCDVFVVILSPKWLESRACESELKYAQQLGKFILPVLIADPAGLHVPQSLSEVQRVDYRARDPGVGLALSAAIERSESTPALPQPLPEPPPLPMSELEQQAELLRRPSLSKDEQTILRVKLTGYLRDPKQADDARSLLEKMLLHPDLRANVADEIRAALAEFQSRSKLETAAQVAQEGSEVTAPAKPGLFSLIQSLLPVLAVGGFVLLVGGMIVRDALFGPRIQVDPTDLDWLPKTPLVGQEVELTGKYIVTYRQRTGLTWDRDEVTGKELKDVFRATWSIDGKSTLVEVPLAVMTGDVVNTSHKTTFDRPGAHEIKFDVRSGKGGRSDGVVEVKRTIYVQPASQ